MPGPRDNPEHWTHQRADLRDRVKSLAHALRQAEMEAQTQREIALDLLRIGVPAALAVGFLAGFIAAT